MDSTLKKQHLIFDVLDGNYDRETATGDKVELRNFAAITPPRLILSRLLWFLNAGVGIIFGTFFIIHFKDAEVPQIELAGSAIFVLLAFWLSIWFVKRERKYSKFLESLQAPFLELSELSDCLNEYLQIFDKRTSRYFHCVTNSKVTAYYVLSQINTEMKKIIDEVSQLLDKPSYRNISLAAYLLQGSIVVSEGLIASVGQTHVVPLTRLYSTMLQLIENLEEDLKTLEEDIRHHQERNPSPDSK